ncbi:MAG TPA: hypothetical protein VJQ48_15930 [Candidatus Binatia bacterium]|nr:hypothetical protein [Candidatus Binatia bacterium]
MRAIVRSSGVLLLFTVLFGAATVQSWAAAAKVSFDEKAVAEFYKGKTVRIIVGFSAGGGYDAYSRVIGRHLHKHIPGNPTVVVDNMAAYWPTCFPFHRNRTSNTNRKTTCHRLYQYVPPCVQGRAERPTINLPGLWFSF